MEHRALWKNLEYLLLTILMLSILAACRDPMPNPELIDPIYNDLGSQLKTVTGDIKEQEEAIQDLKEKIHNLNPLDQIRPHMKRELSKREEALTQLKQRSLYLEIRQEQRKKFDQEDYMIAFRADKPWPNPVEMAEYKKMLKLIRASPNWADRVPKTTRYSKKTSEAPAEKPKSEHGEH